MPLINSTTAAALRANTATEIANGKDPKQAYAIGWAVRRRARKKK